jgi:Tfp pilus assembly protein PilP
MTVRGTIALAFVAIAATCTTSVAQAPPAPPAPAITSQPVISSPMAPPTYERKGRRDPFQALEIIQPDVRPHAVAAARLKGIVRGGASRVLIETPDGMGYILRVGDIFADGRLVEIGADRVVFSVSPRRGSTIDRIVLRLPDD